MGRLAVVAACLLLISSGSLAQDWKQVRKADEAKWAKETRLDPGTIHKLWRQASHAANEKDDESRIADLDVEGRSSLESREELRRPALWRTGKSPLWRLCATAFLRSPRRSSSCKRKTG